MGGGQQMSLESCSLGGSSNLWGPGGWPGVLGGEQNKLEKLPTMFIDQRCPTLSPFATCGDRPSKCGDKKFFPDTVGIRKAL